MFLTKEKKRYKVRFFQEENFLDDLEYDNCIKISLEIDQKKQNNQNKQSINIVILGFNSVMVSGREGDLFLIKIQQFK